MAETSLRSDCTRCAALCCMAFAFEISDDFAFDKAAETPCSNLDARGQCRIHEDLDGKGFRGCMVYECHGAGQRVTQELFGGRSWQDDGSLVTPMSVAFGKMRRLHDLLVLLEAAAKLPLSDLDERVRVAHVGRVEVYAGELPSDATLDEVADRVRAFLMSLRPYAGSLKNVP